MLETLDSVLDMWGGQDGGVSVGGKRGGHPLFPPILSLEQWKSTQAYRRSHPTPSRRERRNTSPRRSPLTPSWRERRKTEMRRQVMTVQATQG